MAIHPKNLMLLWEIEAADFNVTTDQVFVRKARFVNYMLLLTKAVALDGSIASAVGGIYTNAGKTGVALVAASQAYTNASATNLALPMTIAPVGHGIHSATPILSLSTPHGSAATARVMLFGVPLS